MVSYKNTMRNNLNNKLIRIEELKLALDESEDILKSRIANILDIPLDDLDYFVVSKKAIDSRNKNKILFVYTLDVKIKNLENFLTKINTAKNDFKKIIERHKIREYVPFEYKIKKSTKKTKRPVIVGSGPAGLFCALVLAKAGLKPAIIERGEEVKNRVRDVEAFFKSGKLNPNSNVQFGEGGAGTFSDGKLYTLVNDPRSKFVFDELLLSGAPKSISYDANPHIGTDKLREVIVNIRKKIENYGGEFNFNSCLTGIEKENDKINSIKINNNKIIEVDNLVLALGHSARDTYEMLYEKGLSFSAKPFSIGLRIEHKAEMINRSQYGKYFNHPKLPTARYKLVAHLPDNRSVYTFCMCPGGYVVAASSELGKLVVNGMSEYAQDNENSNSAILVNVFPEDFASNHPLAGIEFQRKWEEKAFALGGKNYNAPVQLLGDFLGSRKSKKIGEIKPSYRPGVTLSSLDESLPDFVTESIRKAIPLLDRKIKGFAHPEAILTGIETRSSSPLRIFRDDNFESNIKGIYPAGEGSGYAGGITSSAIDGIKVAETILKQTN